MAKAVNPVPPGMQPLIPYLTVRDAPAAIAFYQKSLGATERFRMADPASGRVMHAELEIAGCVLMLTEENAEWGQFSPQHFKGTPVLLMLYVPDCDATAAQAVAAGATILMPFQDMFWGDRFGKLQDPFGHVWSLATHIRDVPEDEMKAALAKMGA